MKRITVLELASAVDILSDDIPVTVKTRNGEILHQNAKSLYWLCSHGYPGVLEAKVKSLQICRDCITLTVQPKDYDTKI